jgi:aspartyl aminopeptidase
MYLFFNHSISANTGIRAVDLGMPQLSMHSIREMMGVSDLTFAYKLFTEFFNKFSEIDSSLK